MPTTEWGLPEVCGPHKNNYHHLSPHQQWSCMYLYIIYFKSYSFHVNVLKTGIQVDTTFMVWNAIGDNEEIALQKIISFQENENFHI